MLTKTSQSKQTTFEQLREKYTVEKELANRLRVASREDRRYLYGEVYNEYFKRLPSVPQLTLKADPSAQARKVARQMNLLRPYLRRHYTFLEIGPGDCSLCLEVTKYVNKVVAVEVSEEIAKGSQWPENFTFAISDGIGVPLPSRSVHVVYSNQLMEHLHPDDALEQLAEIHQVLAPGGTYICITPNRLSGPHDISKYFDETPTGFHLKEYTVTELEGLLRQVGFSGVKMLLGAKGKYISSPTFLARWLEAALGKLPPSIARNLSHQKLLRPFLGINLTATKAIS